MPLFRDNFNSTLTWWLFFKIIFKIIKWTVILSVAYIGLELMAYKVSVLNRLENKCDPKLQDCLWWYEQNEGECLNNKDVFGRQCYDNPMYPGYHPGPLGSELRYPNLKPGESLVDKYKEGTYVPR